MSNPYNFPGVYAPYLASAMAAVPYVKKAYGYAKNYYQKRGKGSFGSGSGVSRSGQYYPENRYRGKQPFKQYGELKTFDTTIGSQNCKTTGTVTSLVLIPQGDTPHTREGKSVHVSGILIRGRVFPGTTQSTPMAYHLAVVLDRKPRGSITAVVDAFEGDMNIDRLPQDKSHDRIKVLYDKRAYMTAEADSVLGTGSGVCINKFIKCNFNTVWEEDDTSGLSAGVVDNLLTFMTGGSGGADDSTTCNIGGNIRVYFRDC